MPTHVICSPPPTYKLGGMILMHPLPTCLHLILGPYQQNYKMAVATGLYQRNTVHLN